ncbi:MAG: 1-acyl-sn-glycerol-3-phosphate acyltransferase [Moraxellaceae bacterium]|nr:1-acyl-sn-glycerol-3-phosphate acyltransferase [Pseudobdellovibrionaceae bacterium]
MNYLRAFFKLLLFFIILTSYFLVASLIYVSTFNPISRRRRLIKNTQRYAHFMSFIFKVKLFCKNPIDQYENSLIIGNHLGFIDLLCLQRIQPCVFITSVEMKNTPLLGQISQLAGCAYVDRLNRSHIQDEMQDIVTVLKEGFRIVLYAEAQASNGEQVLPFKKTLMMAAGYADRPIRPYVFNFTKVNGRPVEFKDRDHLCWYGDQTFFPAIFRTMQLKSIECEIEFLEPVYIKPDDDRTVVSTTIHDLIEAKFKPFVRYPANPLTQS